ncbi:MAG: NAD(P)-dependent oxidoreductase [Nocardioides sp.]
MSDGSQTAHVYVPQELHPDAMALLDDAGVVVHRGFGADAEAEAEIAPLLDAVVVRHHGVSAATIAGAPRLKVVARAGVGFENIPIDEARQRGIPVYITPGANSRSVAEHALALILALLKDIVRWDRLTRERPDDLYQVRERGLAPMLTGARLGLIGVGGIGTELARIGTRGFAMDVLGYHPTRSEHPIQALGVQLTSSLPQLLGWADIVSIQVPLTEATTGLLGAEEFALMQPHSLLINVARGELIDEKALAVALERGRPGGAGIDVWHDSVPARDHPLLASSKTVCTPHRAGRTEDAQRALGVLAVTAALDVLAGRTPTRVRDITAVPAPANSPRRER